MGQLLSFSAKPEHNNDINFLQELSHAENGSNLPTGSDSKTSLHAEDDDVLETLADTIKFISDRDLNRYIRNEAQKKSPWRMDSVLFSPMLSSPRILDIPYFDSARQNQIRKHYDDIKLIERAKKHEKLQQKQHRRMRSKSVENESVLSNHEDPYDVILKDEDEQWDQKRFQKLKKIVESSSSTSLGDFSSASGYSTVSKSYTPTNEILEDLRAHFAQTKTSIGVSVMYGIVNAVIVLPVLMSFGNIIYHDAFFRPYLPVLIKLTVLSGVVHQICFSTWSTLPFSVGQVQDAGLIFLSAIATNIVSYCKARNYDDETILATTVVGLSIFTACLGLSLVVIGRLKLASYIQVLPTPVVGGYLAFIGFFCGQSGMSLMSAVQVSSLLNWYQFFEGAALRLVLPGILGGLTIYLSVRKLRHMAVLPICVMSILSVFYLILYLTNTSLSEAREEGWINEADSPPVWYKTWNYFKLNKVVWMALPGQIMTVVSMIFVVALSSSLDIAAIDLEIPKPLEYNYELRMIGISNFVSGILGGYTGSYIFSQSIFNLRAGITTRTAGYIIACLELITVMIPISILNYVPNYIFGSLLIMICIDLMVEWLWEVRSKLTQAEYFVALSTFSLIQVLGVEYGIISGVAVHFILSSLGFNVTKSSNRQSNEKEGRPVLQNGSNHSNCNDSYGATDQDNGNGYISENVVDKPLMV